MIKRMVIAGLGFAVMVSGASWSQAVKDAELRAQEEAARAKALEAAGYAAGPAAVGGQTGEKAPAASMPAATAPRGKWVGILKGLGSDDFAEREAAQKELDKAGVRDREELRGLLTGVTDEEVKARIEGRLEAIEEEAITKPVPITVSIKNASLGEVAAELSKATGARISSWPEDRFTNNRTRYNLEAKEQPFWEVMQLLARQSGLGLQAWDGFKITQQDPGMRNVYAFGGLAIIPQSITRSKTVNLQEQAGKQISPETMNFSYMAALDPRITGAQFTQPAVYKVVDDAGNVLYEQKRESDPQFWDANSGNRGVWNASVQLKIPEKMGTKIALLQGDLRAKVVLKAEKILLTDLEKKVGAAGTDMGGIKFTLSRWKPQPNSVEFQFNTTSVVPVVMNINGRQQGPTLGVAVLDADGKQVWGTTMQGNSGHGGSFGFNEAKQPFKLELSVAKKTKELAFPFELKDLPLPEK